MRARTPDILRAEDCPDIEVRLARRTRHVFPLHTHDVYVLGVMEHGACYGFKPGDERCLVRTGNINCINPGQVHSGIPAGGPTSYRVFYIRPDWLRALAEEAGMPGGWPEFTRFTGPAPEPMLQRLRDLCLFMGRSAGTLARQSAMVEAFTPVLGAFAGVRPGKGPEPDHPGVRRALECLGDRLCEKVTLDELARVAGLSRHHLLRVFRRSMGVPPHAWQTQRRVDLARRLLAKGRDIAAVAQDCGFVDQSHFSRTFKRFTGVTPGGYLNA